MPNIYEIVKQMPLSFLKCLLEIVIYFKNNKMSSIRDFVPLSKLGQGTFSTVYKVRRVSDQKIYALKKVKLNNLSQKQKQNALNEIRILASFECNNIVAYKEAFFDDKLLVLCIVMEYADGGDLHKYITQTKNNFRKVSQVTIWKFAADILLALEHLHSKGILHRDLKSANIFIHGDQYKLGDLNVSKVNGGRLAYTQTGTPYYASPEVWRDQPYDHKSDIWSFGCILYELACLKPPFQGRDMDDLYKSIQRNTYQAIPQQYSHELSQLIDKCLQKNPKRRPKASQLLQHPIICRFKNRKNNPIDEKQSQKQLLRTIKLPNDLRSLAMNLPSSKYDDSQLKISPKNPYLQPNFSKERIDVKNFVSDRPAYSNQNRNNGRGGSGHMQILRNQSQVVNPSHSSNKQIDNQPRLINNSEVFTSPKNIKKLYQNQSANRSPQDMITRKIASAHINSQKRYEHKVTDYTDRKSSAPDQLNPNYSQRRSNIQKKSAILQKYDKFIQKQLENSKKPIGIPRTEKRIVSCQGKNANQYQNYHHQQNPMNVIADSMVGPDRKDIEEWKKKLVKKSRVFSNNLMGRQGEVNYGIK